MPLNPSTTTRAEDILQIRKVIPVYQRDFVWDDDLRLGFFQNLVEAYEEQKDYFIGSMVLRKDDSDVYEIVDGQQRITMLQILLATLLQEAYQLNPSTDYRDLLDQSNKSLRKTELIDGTPRQVSLLDHADPIISDAYHKISTLELIDGDASHVQMVKNLSDAQVDIGEQIKRYAQKSHDAVQTLTGFAHFILQKVVCIHHVAKDLSQALTIYSRLNATGKRLTHLEILKGLSFTAAEGSSTWDALKQKWKKLEELLNTPIKLGSKGADRALIKEETLLAYFVFLRYPNIAEVVVGDKWVSEDGLAKLILSAEMQRVLQDKGSGFLDEIITFASVIRSLRTGANSSSESIENYLVDIAAAAGTQSQWLLIGILLHEYFSDREEAFRALRNMVFVFSIALTGSGSTSGIYKRLAGLVCPAHLNRNPGGEDLERVIKDMHQEIQSRIEMFGYEIENLSYATKSQHKMIRRVFELVEVELYRQFSLDDGQANLLSNFQKKGIDLDHLQPTARAILQPDLQDCIGNLCLFESSLNRGLGDTPFEDAAKREALKKSRFVLTAGIAVPEGGLTGSIGRAHNYIQTRQILNEEFVLERRNEIVGFIKARLLQA
jgi:hypothetical protein